MGKYDKEYYFIESSDDESNPVLTPDDTTADRKFRYGTQVHEKKPLIFFNGMQELQRKSGVLSLKEPPAILFSGSNPIVPGIIREALLEVNIPNLNMHPVVYVHDNKKRYENYWFMAFSERVDCWDRNNSDYDQDDPSISLGDFNLEQVYRYSLNEYLLEKVPLKNRLLFQIGGVLSASFVCHKSLVNLFNRSVNDGVKTTLVSDF